MLNTDRHRALGGVTVGDEFIHCHSKGPDVRRKIELALSQTLWSIPEKQVQKPHYICLLEPIT